MNKPIKLTQQHIDHLKRLFKNDDANSEYSSKDLQDIKDSTLEIYGITYEQFKELE